jgi:hypothetical protein
VTYRARKVRARSSKVRARSAWFLAANAVGSVLRAAVAEKSKSYLLAITRVAEQSALTVVDIRRLADMYWCPFIARRFHGAQCSWAFVGFGVFDYRGTPICTDH